MMEQVWKHVLFFHWQLDPQELAPHVPFELDLFQGKAVISIVPFRMEGIRFPPFPQIPFASSLWELNLRTYVKVKNKIGVYFFTLDTDSRLGTWIANRFFGLPYRLATMKGQVLNHRYQFESQRNALEFKLEAHLTEKPKPLTPLDHFATDRVHLFTKRRNQAYCGTVIHRPWQLEEVGEFNFVDRFSCQLPILLGSKPDAVAYSRELKVRFQPFVAI